MIYNKVLMVMNAPFEADIKVGMRKVLRDEHNLYFPHDIVSVLKSKRVRWLGDVVGLLTFWRRIFLQILAHPVFKM